MDFSQQGVGIKMMYNILYAQKVVEEDIPKLPRKNRLQIKRAIEERLAINPVAFGKFLRNNLAGYMRLRVGDYRIIYKIEDNNVKILKIGTRKDVYVQRTFDDN